MSRGFTAVLPLLAVLLSINPRSATANEQPCGTAAKRFLGNLCGPPTRPCIVVHDEDLPGPGGPAFRNGGPSLLLDQNDLPQILFYVAQDGYTGYLAYRTAGGGWDIETLPFPVAIGEIDFDSNEQLYLIADDGQGAVRLWTLHNGEWSQVETSESLSITRFAIDDGDCFHYGPVRLAPSGHAHRVRWATEQLSWALVWGLDGAGDERVYSLNNGYLPWFPIAFAVTGAAELGDPGVPHILANRYRGPSGTYESSGTEITYATRAPSGQWTVLPVAQGSLNEFVFERCGPPPAPNHTRCEYAYETFRPMDVVTSGNDEVLLLYGGYKVSADYHAVCSSYGSCRWEGESRIDGTLYAAWLDNNEVQHAALLGGFSPSSISTAVGLDGQIHMAAYDGAAAFSDSTVRYMILAPEGVASPAPSRTPSPTALNTPTATATSITTATPTATSTPTCMNTPVCDRPYTHAWCGNFPGSVDRCDCICEGVQTPTASATPASCVGDCNGDSSVQIDELILGVTVLLDVRPVGACAAIRCGPLLGVSIDCAVAAVVNALNGCPQPSTQLSSGHVRMIPWSASAAKRMDTSQPASKPGRLK